MELDQPTPIYTPEENLMEPHGSDICFLLLGMSWEVAFYLDVQTSASLSLSSISNTPDNIEDSYLSPPQSMCGLTESRLDDMYTYRPQFPSDESVIRRLE